MQRMNAQRSSERARPDIMRKWGVKKMIGLKKHSPVSFICLYFARKARIKARRFWDRGINDKTNWEGTPSAFVLVSVALPPDITAWEAAIQRPERR